MHIELDNDSVTLTKAERLILANQYSIMMMVDKKNAGDYEAWLEALQNGYAAPISDMFERIYDGLSEEECSFVIHVMAMYDALQYSYKELGEDAAAQAGVKKSQVTFLGFSGNEETTYMTYCRYVVKHQEQFTHLDAAGAFNSHFPAIPRYRAMIEVWENELGSAHELTGEQMKRLLESRQQNAPV